jgi:guanylate kinase
MSSNALTGKCIIFSAPSGAGKTTIVRHLLGQRNDLAFSVSATSRAPRGQEKEGIDYYYLTPDAFRDRITANDFVEWEEVYTDQYYGTLRAEVERLWNDGKTVVFDVDVEGGVNLKKAFGERALAVFVMPPSLEALEVRLRARGTESEDNVVRRMAKAERELAYAPRFDVQLINDQLDAAKAAVERVVAEFLEG